MTVQRRGWAVPVILRVKVNIIRKNAGEKGSLVRLSAYFVAFLESSSVTIC